MCRLQDKVRLGRRVRRECERGGQFYEAGSVWGVVENTSRGGVNACVETGSGGNKRSRET